MSVVHPHNVDKSIWQLKAHVEAEYPDFPNIDVSSPTFSLQEYVNTLSELMHGLGAPREDITLAWQNLNCTVPVEAPDATVKTVISTFTDIAHAIKHGGGKLLHPHTTQEEADVAQGKVPTPKTAKVLSNATGFVEPGDMCLVLGPSGSGSSLLLSRISGRPVGQQVKNEGQVLYNGEEKLFGLLSPPHFVQLVGQPDEHIAPLTVRHTLEFAANCKWPEWMPHVESIRRNDVILTAKMLRIERTLDTIVGNDTLRGISGGERKRVTIAEMLIGLNAGIVVMDNWSKGLDSTTTLGITRSMREYANFRRSPVIASMQTPGMDAFKLFDSVCVLDKGHVLYFGPRDWVEDWFISLGFHRPPQRSIPDFVATISNPELRSEYLPPDMDISHLKEPPPTTPEEFAARFAQSDIAAKAKEKLRTLASPKSFDDGSSIPKALREAGMRSNLQKARYQIRAIATRQLRFYEATRKTVFADIMQNLILGLILGSIFWQLPLTAGGANSRSGLIFLTVLFMGLSALAKLPEKHESRKVFTKQRDSSFYNAWPYILTLAFIDVIVETIRTAFFVVPLFLMAGMSIGSSGQRLLYAVLLISMLTLIMTSIVRLLVALFEDPDAAQGVGGIFTITMVLYAGFMKAPDKIFPWLKWIYWADPLHYAFEAVALNEYDGLVFQCRTRELVPPVEAIPVDFRVCPVSTGTAFLETDLGITNGPIFRLYYFLVLLGYLALFGSLSAIATALAKSSGHALKIGMKDVDGNAGGLDADATSTIVDIREPEKGVKSDSRFTFMDVRYAVDGGKKALLNGISGLTTAGSVVLLMGESGAGKSTLLDVCALRKTMGKGTSTGGDIRINGYPTTPDLISHQTGYCEQNDLHIGEATVREAIMFSAKLRLPKTISLSEKRVRAMETMELLGLSPFANVLVKALGSGELKILTMALEVVADPLVLFLDEPTSGISASSALVVAKALRKIADTGACVICTIHQPSKEVFSMFNKLLLLKRGGQQVYFGDIGEGGAVLRHYFQSRGASEMNEDANPADWMLDVIADEGTDWTEEWSKSEEKSLLERDLEKLQKPDADKPNLVEEKFEGVGTLTQFREVCKRLFLRYWRLPEYNFTRVILMFAIALNVGLLFLREIDNTQAGAALAFSALFLSIIPSSLSAQNVIPPTVDGRAVFYREIASGTYRPLTFHSALGFVEVPFTAVATSVFVCVFYFLVGLDPSRFFYFFLAANLLYYFAVAFGVALASITPDGALALALASSVISVLTVLSGFFITKEELPVWWRWSTWINPFFYYLSGLVQNQMENQDFTCEPSELGQFERPPSFSSCSDIPGGNFEAVQGGGESFCSFCPISSGDDLIESFGAGVVNKWISLLALLGFILISRAVAGFGFSKLRFLSR